MGHRRRFCHRPALQQGDGGQQVGSGVVTRMGRRQGGDKAGPGGGAAAPRLDGRGQWARLQPACTMGSQGRQAQAGTDPAAAARSTVPHSGPGLCGWGRLEWAWVVAGAGRPKRRKSPPAVLAGPKVRASGLSCPNSATPPCPVRPQSRPLRHNAHHPDLSLPHGRPCGGYGPGHGARSGPHGARRRAESLVGLTGGQVLGTGRRIMLFMGLV